MLMWGAAKWCLWLCVITVNVGICWLRFMMVCWSVDWGLWWCADVGICWWRFMMVCWCGDLLMVVYDGVLMWGSADWDLSWYWDLLIIMIDWFFTLTCIHLHVSRFHFLQNDLHHLQGLIDKWRSVCQQAILDLHQLTPDPRPSLTQLVQQLGIDTKLVCYNDEEECFDATWKNDSSMTPSREAVH